MDDPVSLQVPRLAGQAAVDHEAVYLQVLLRGELVTRGPAFAYDVFGGPADPPGLLLAPGLHAPILPPRTGHRRTVARAVGLLPYDDPVGSWPRAQDPVGCSPRARFTRSTAGGTTSPIPVHTRSVTASS